MTASVMSRGIVHCRITLADLLAYRDDMVARRRAVLDQMFRDAEELGLYD